MYRAFLPENGFRLIAFPSVSESLERDSRIDIFDIFRGKEY